MSNYSRQLDGHEESRNNGPGAECHQGREPQVPSQEQNYKPLHYHSLKRYPPEITARSQLCFGFRPRKAVDQAEQCHS